MSINKKVLYCDSKGDRRFSAFYAKIQLDGVVDSIENFYQNSKRDEYGNIPGKGKKVSYMVFRSKKLPANKLTDFYKYLWKLYFQQNPELLEYASQFEEFIDRFRGKCINCQADIIKELVSKYLENKPTLTNHEPIVGSQEVKVMKKVKSLKSLSNKLDNKRQKTVFELQLEEEQKAEDFLLRNEELERNANAYTLYIKDDPRTGVVDKDLYEILMNFCVKAIKKRLVMLLDIESIISTLLNIEKYTYGFTQNPTEYQAKSLEYAYAKIKNLLKDNKVKDFIKDNNDFTVYGQDSLTRGDYISTYQRVLRMLTSISEESLRDFTDIVNNTQDELQELILENTYEPLQVSYSENEESEDSEYIPVEY